MRCILITDYEKLARQEAKLRYRKTKKGWLTNLYGNQVSSSKKRGHHPPSYTKEELKVWLEDTNFNDLWDTYVTSGYDKPKIPSIDRLKDSLPYTLDNIQVITWKENWTKGKNGPKSVKQLNEFTDVLIAEYTSMSEANRATKVAIDSISKCCAGKLMTAGGYKWEFIEN